jgi:hypothetical protein
MIDKSNSIFTDFFNPKNILFFLFFNILFFSLKFIYTFDVLTFIALLFLFFFLFKTKEIIYYLFLFFVYGFCFYGQTFAKFNIKFFHMPLYSLEILLFVLFCVYFIWCLFRDRIYILSLDRKFDIIFFVWMSIGLICFVRGFFLYNDKVFLFRQISFWVYSLLIFITPIVIDSYEKIERFFMVIILGTFIHGVSFFLYKSLILTESFSYFYFCIVFISMFILFFSYKMNRLYNVLALLILGILFYYVAIWNVARATWMGLLLSFFLFFAYFKKFVCFDKTKFYKITIFSIFILLNILLIKSEAVYNEAGEFASIFFIKTNTNTVSVNNANWRLDVWKDYINEGKNRLLLGWGCGRKYVPPVLIRKHYGGDWQSDGWQDPHNCYVSLFYQCGLIGLFFFLMIVYYSIKQGIDYLKSDFAYKNKIYIIISMLIVIFILGSSFFMPMLFPPYMGSFFWIFIGMIFAVRKVSLNMDK